MSALYMVRLTSESLRVQQISRAILLAKEAVTCWS
jgi:hypothetical protein